MLQKRFPQLLTTFIVILLAACGGLSSKQRSAAEEAIKSLRKISASTQVGVNYQQYGVLIIDAQAQVNEALAVLPDGELKNEMNATMESYADASQVWGAKIKSGTDEIFTESHPRTTVIIPKYSLPASDYGSSGKSINGNQALKIIWDVANKHLDRASTLLK
jgi:hypothetical protein